MTSPINSSSLYAQSQVIDFDPSLASCEASPPEPSPIELMPVTIDGDAGKRALIDQFDRGRAPDCSAERNDDIVWCLTGASTVAAVASSVK